MQKHGCLEKVLDSLDSSKYSIPDPFPYHEARRLFQGGAVTTPAWLSSSSMTHSKLVFGQPGSCLVAGSLGLQSIQGCGVQA